MKTKEQQKDEAWETYKAIKDPAHEAYEAIENPAYDAYQAKCREIDAQDEISPVTIITNK